MKEIFLLTQILLKNSLSSQKKTKQSKKDNILKVLGWILIYGYIMGVIGFLSFEIIFSLKLVNQTAVFLNLCLVIMLGFTTMRTLFSSINVLFFSKDTEFLLPLPVDAYKIVIAKMNCIIISEYMMYFIIFIPAIIAYGVILKLNICFYIVAFLVMLIFPIIPIMLISALMTIIMKFTNIFKNKDFVQYITVILSLILIIGIEFLVGADSNITNEELAQKLVEVNGLVDVYSKGFMTLKPAINALINYNTLSGIANLLILTLATVFIYSVVIFIMSKLYIKVVTNTVGSKASKNKKEHKKLYKQNSHIKAYLKKEFQNLIRNPIYFMQCVIPAFLFPVLILGSTYLGLKSEGVGDITELKNMLADMIITPVGMAVSVSIIMFFFMFNYVSITSISRDGENAVFMKYIPISLEKQCLYKILPGIILNFVPMFIVSVIIKIILQERVVIEVLVAINVITFLINVLNNYLMILIDLKNPKLSWTSEYAVVKQNINMLLECLIILLEIIICILWGLFINTWALFVVSTCMILFVGIKKTKEYINKNEYKLFEKIS